MVLKTVKAQYYILEQSAGKQLCGQKLSCAWSEFWVTISVLFLILPSYSQNGSHSPKHYCPHCGGRKTFPFPCHWPELGHMHGQSLVEEKEKGCHQRCFLM
jgi:hypothetical protein